jgi:hypothetical protein
MPEPKLTVLDVLTRLAWDRAETTEKAASPASLRQRVTRLFSSANRGEYLFYIVLSVVVMFLSWTWYSYGPGARLDNPTVTSIARDPALQIGWWALI